MRNTIILTSIFLTPMLGALTSYETPKVDCLPELEIQEEQIPQEDSLLVFALIQVESAGNDSCVGDKHLIIPSIGCLQIRPIMVREVNRILKRQKNTLRFKNKDRWSRKKSIQMFYIWKNYHHKDDTVEVIARCWNGGPKGYKRKSTLHYWNKVNRLLKLRQDNNPVIE